jgi:hypothetical protein
LFKRGSLIQGDFHIIWLGITFIRRKIPTEGRKKEGRKKEKEEEFDWRGIPEMISLFTESFPYLKRILNAFIRSLSIVRFSLSLTIGLDSPADTAVMSGYLWALASVVNVFPKAHLSVKPDFQEKKLDASMMAELKIRLLWIAVAFIRAFTKRSVRRLFRKMRR